MKIFARQFNLLNRNTPVVVLCAVISGALITPNAFGAWGMDNSPTIEWGSCPCVNTNAAWSKIHGINRSTATFPYVLDSVDQKQVSETARSTNNILDNLSESTSAVGKIEVIISTSPDVLQCSAHNFLSDKGASTTHAVISAPESVNDCRAGLYNLAGQPNPMSL